MDINALLSTFNRNDYQRDNFDAFLEKNKFSFTLPAIHITGTNGKGSTAHYIASIYKNSGYKVGRFTSPWLFKVNEMISINDEPISDESFLKIFNEYKKSFEKFDLSAFEIETFIALTYFKQQQCDICVIECGMGGEIDATNVFVPVLSIITSISLEHTGFLGHTISEIAEQKCGIIKDKVPVLIDEFDEDAIATIYKATKAKEAPVHFIKKHIETSLNDSGISLNYYPFGDVQLSTFAPYSTIDASFALEAVLLLNEQFPIQMDKVNLAMQEVKMDCRFDIVSKQPLVIIDGAHNPEGAKATVEAVNSFVRGKPIHVVFACFRDKNLGGLLSQFGSLGGDLTLTTFPHPRARTEDEYFLFLGDHPFENDPISLIKRLMEQYPEDAILVTGSLAFAAYIKKEVFPNA